MTESRPSQLATPSTTLALVVVIHESAPELLRLLDSVDRHLRPRPQVVVVDNGSRDGGGDLALRRGAQLVSPGRNLGFGEANNLGLANVRADVTALVNPDVECLDAGLAALAALAAARDRLFVPRLLNDDGTLQRSAHPQAGRWGGLIPALVPPVLLAGALQRRVEPWRSERPRSVGWAIAACLVARSATLRSLGPFDPRIFMFFEDLDLCLRARAAGVATELRPEVALRHSGGHSTRCAYRGEPHEVMARRRREVLSRALGARALALDDAAQALTFASRIFGRRLIGRPWAREHAQLAALRAARHGD